MKYAFSLLILLFSITLSAQNYKMTLSETLSDENYEFKVKVDKHRLADLQWCYNQLTGQPKTRTILGIATYEEDGLTIQLNTKAKQITMYTDTLDEDAVASAKAKGKMIKDRLQAAKKNKKSATDW
ncbi:hypothetical protein [Neolewinella persica]|uniref:hypothetical protein n=1 Tax=Neolewinella persica TaxID=70998 RepID=UPI000376E43D|nr:hypothetical protein [Neolewinella persica]